MLANIPEARMSVPLSLRRVGLTGVMCSQLTLRSVWGTDTEVKHSCSTCHWVAYTIVYSSMALWLLFALGGCKFFFCLICTVIDTWHWHSTKWKLKRIQKTRITSNHSWASNRRCAFIKLRWIHLWPDRPESSYRWERYKSQTRAKPFEHERRCPGFATQSGRSQFSCH